MDMDHIGWRPVSRTVFNQVEHLMYVALAGLLSITCVLALGASAAALVEGLVNWRAIDTVFGIIERLLVVLMLVEILHTVLVSVRSGALTAEPFLVVGLIASIRRILVITLETSQASHGGAGDASDMSFRQAMIELAVLGGLIMVMVVSISLLRRHRESQDTNVMSQMQ